MLTSTDWLRGLDETALVALLRARPDLAVPSPTDLQALARRLDTPPSVWRAMESLDQFGIQVLSALVLLDAEKAEVSPFQVQAMVGRGATKKQLLAALKRLETLALARGREGLMVPRVVAESLGPHPAGLGPTTDLAADEVAERVAQVDERALGILNRLADGPPVGTVSAGAAIAPVVKDLVSRGLLIAKSPTTVELPRVVGIHLRGKNPLGPILAQPVHPDPAQPGVSTVNGTAGGQALELLRLLARTLELLSATPHPVLKSGGLGVRESRRLAKDLDVNEGMSSLYMELLAAAGLITGSPGTDNRGTKVWTPTHSADEWLQAPDEQAWALMASIWLDLRRDPARAGTRDANDKTLNTLAPELTWLRGPADRRWVLQPLAELPIGSGWSPDKLTLVLGWRSPLRGADRRDRVISSVLGQATALGIVAFDSLSSAGRALLADRDDVAAVLAKSLPTPVETILVQADLTVIAPGRLTPALAAALAVAAELESAGSASVYRVTPTSIRRALDAGMSSGELHRLFTDHSTTDIPQALTYLIDDIARRHGVLRTGQGEAYLRCEDPVQIDQAISQMAAVGILLRKLAPTVAITGTGLDELIVELRKAGLAPAAEDEYGAIIQRRQAVHRAKAGLVTHQRWREPAAPSADQLIALVARMKSADGSELSTPQSPSEAVAELRAAADSRGSVWIEYVNTEGASSRRLIEPLAIAGGMVSAFDRLSKQMRTFALHRITAIQTAAPTDTP